MSLPKWYLSDRLIYEQDQLNLHWWRKRSWIVECGSSSSRIYLWGSLNLNAQEIMQGEKWNHQAKKWGVHRWNILYSQSAHCAVRPGLAVLRLLSHAFQGFHVRNWDQIRRLVLFSTISRMLWTQAWNVSRFYSVDRANFWELKILDEYFSHFSANYWVVQHYSLDQEPVGPIRERNFHGPYYWELEREHCLLSCSNQISQKWTLLVQVLYSHLSSASTICAFKPLLLGLLDP